MDHRIFPSALSHAAVNGRTGRRLDMPRSGLTVSAMPLRVIALLLTIATAVAVVAVASPGVAASPDVAGLVDDGALDPEPAIAAAPVALPAPVRRELRLVVAPPAELPGRLCLASVFRPPRRFAPA
jgi:hypothetical protein